MACVELKKSTKPLATLTLFPAWTCGLKLDKANRGKVREWVEKTAEVLQLTSLLQRKPREWSGGQRQRVAIGRAMAREPQIMLCMSDRIALAAIQAALQMGLRVPEDVRIVGYPGDYLYNDAARQSARLSGQL